MIKKTHLSSLINKIRFKLEESKWKKLFGNYNLIEKALTKKSPGLIKLLTNDGLKINIRQNVFDARIVREVFIKKQYILNFILPENPVIIDIGGYIGDFSLYASKYLRAKRVIVCEPVLENFELLNLNISDNNFNNIIKPIKKAVGKNDNLKIYIHKLGDNEIHASSHLNKEDAEERLADNITLNELIQENQIENVDLLKIDCEGNEYEILLSTDSKLFNKIDNIVFEYHKIDNYKQKLRKVLKKLKNMNYEITRRGSLIYAKKI